MLGVSIEKMLLVAVLVGAIAGPERLLSWVRSGTAYLRSFRAAYSRNRRRIVDELDQAAPDWRELDPRRFDPRRIVRDALHDEPAPGAQTATIPDASVESAPRRFG